MERREGERERARERERGKERGKIKQLGERNNEILL